MASDMPSILQNIVSAFSRDKDVTGLHLTPTQAYQSLLGFMSRDAASPVRLGEENRNWVAACTGAIAQSVACIEFELKQYGSDGLVENVQEHPLLDLLSYVNEYMDQFELIEITSVHLSVYGNAFWLLDGVSDDGKGTPTAIYPLIPKFVTMVRGAMPQAIKEYQYKVDNKVFKFDPKRILQFRDVNGDDPLWGMGKLEKAFDSVESDTYTRLWSKAFFKNGARIDQVIEAPNQLTPEQAKQILEVFNSRHQGVDKAHKTAILPMGGKLVNAGVNPKDMDFPQLRSTSRDEILAMFGVPKSILGLVEDVNRASAEAANYVFALRTVKPVMRKITSVINEFLVPFFDKSDKIWLAFKDPVPENRVETVSMYQAALGGKPWLSVNEVRAMEGMPKIENGDSVMTDFAAIPLGEPLPEKPTKAARPNRVHGKRFSKESSLHRNVQKSAISLGNSLEQAIKEATDESSKRAELDEAEWKRFQVNVNPYIKTVTKTLKDLAKDQSKEVLANLPEAVKGMVSRLAAGDVRSKVVLIDELLDEDEAVSIMVNALSPIYQELVAKEGSAVLESITGAAFDARTERVQKSLKHAINLLSTEYTKTTKTRLQEALEAGLEDGESVDKLADRVSDVYTQISQSRATAVAMTETNRVGNLAAKQAMLQSGVVKTIRWYTSNDDVCDFCQEMSGMVEDINSAFFEKGDTLETVDGQTIELDYDTVDTPPLHTSCRCYVRPDQISI